MLNCGGGNLAPLREQMELIVYRLTENLVLDLPWLWWQWFTLHITREKGPYRSYTTFFIGMSPIVTLLGQDHSSF